VTHGTPLSSCDRALLTDALATLPRVVHASSLAHDIHKQRARYGVVLSTVHALLSALRGLHSSVDAESLGDVMQHAVAAALPPPARISLHVVDIESHGSALIAVRSGCGCCCLLCGAVVVFVCARAAEFGN